jgi:hypothetical protein
MKSILCTTEVKMFLTHATNLVFKILKTSLNNLEYTIIVSSFSLNKDMEKSMSKKQNNTLRYSCKELGPASQLCTKLHQCSLAVSADS